MDKRSENRHPTIEILIFHLDNQTVEGVLINVSSGGALVALEPNEAIDFTSIGKVVKITKGLSHSPFLKERARIVRIEENKQNTQIGLVFDEPLIPPSSF